MPAGPRYREVLYVAPGAGLGHLSRAAALALGLEERGVPVRIVTDSPFAGGLARRTGCRIERIPTACWVEELPARVRVRPPRLMVLDTFPAGLRGEWAGGYPPGIEVALVARRLKIEEYLATFPEAPHPTRVLAAEALEEDHAAWLATGGSAVERLPGRIRLPIERLEAAADPALERALEGGETGLVVHSGPPREVDVLLAEAERQRRRLGAAGMALVSPAPMERGGVRAREAFPAAQLYHRAAFVVTGGGYNSVAEGAALARHHRAVPLERRWDDQAGRVRDPSNGAADGTPRASELLAGWWQEAAGGRERP